MTDTSARDDEQRDVPVDATVEDEVIQDLDPSDDDDIRGGPCYPKSVKPGRR